MGDFMPFEFKRIGIGTILVVPVVFNDLRGAFAEEYNKYEFKKAGIEGEFIQRNYSFSVNNVIRGMHFQRKPYEQAKLVTCAKGEILDIVVDIRKGSNNYGKYSKQILSGRNRFSLYVPRGFAHGFLVLSDEAEVIYDVDNKYSPTNEGGVVWNDPDIGIDWGTDKPILSEKDRSWPRLKDI